MKLFRVEFSTTIYGSIEIEAVDEQDAEEQFSVDSISDFDDDKISACIDNIVEVKSKKRIKNKK